MDPRARIVLEGIDRELEEYKERRRGIEDEYKRGAVDSYSYKRELLLITGSIKGALDRKREIHASEKKKYERLLETRKKEYESGRIGKEKYARYSEGIAKRIREADELLKGGDSYEKENAYASSAEDGERSEEYNMLNGIIFLCFVVPAAISSIIGLPMNFLYYLVIVWFTRQDTVFSAYGGAGSCARFQVL